jgi:hypothetical protein
MRWAAASALVLLTLAGCTSSAGSGSGSGAAGTRAGSTSPPSLDSSQSATATPTQTTSGLPSATTIKYFDPIDAASGEPLVPITATRRGSCWEGSVAVQDPHAYRCMSGNYIHDPCFSSEAASGEVVCVSAPWPSGTILKLTRPLPPSQMGGPVDPTWALELTNGDRCVAITGTAETVAGIAMSWGCKPGAEAGGLDRHGALWMIEYRAPHSSTIISVGVATAWG